MLPSIFGENLFDDFFEDSFERNFFGSRNPLYGKHAKNLLKTDVKESKDCYKLAIDLPGFKKEDVQVDLKDGYLTVNATKGMSKEEEKEDSRYIRRERYQGSCSRSFYVGNVQPQDVKCKYEFGVLKIQIPQMEAKALENPNCIKIE